MRSIRVVVPPPFLLSTTAIWIYLGLAAVLGIGFLLWHQNRLRRQKSGDKAEEPDAEATADDAATDQTQEETLVEPEHEVTDEYEIIEE